MACAEVICGLAEEVYTFTIKGIPLHIGSGRRRAYALRPPSSFCSNLNGLHSHFLKANPPKESHLLRQ
jgi:hypothetical protein